MNETRRAALVEKVTGILDARSQLTATELSHRDICQDANELVEAVTRHRDAEIREAFATILEKYAKDTVWVNDHTTALDALDAAIGRAERGAEK